MNPTSFLEQQPVFTHEEYKQFLQSLEPLIRTLKGNYWLTT